MISALAAHPGPAESQMRMVLLGCRHLDSFGFFGASCMHRAMHTCCKILGTRRRAYTSATGFGCTSHVLSERGFPVRNRQ